VRQRIVQRAERAPGGRGRRQLRHAVVRARARAWRGGRRDPRAGTRANQAATAAQGAVQRGTTGRSRVRGWAPDPVDSGGGGM
jgi:hypothetical protein